MEQKKKKLDGQETIPSPVKVQGKWLGGHQAWTKVQLVGRRLTSTGSKFRWKTRRPSKMLESVRQAARRPSSKLELVRLEAGRLSNKPEQVRSWACGHRRTPKWYEGLRLRQEVLKQCGILEVRCGTR